MKGKWTYLRGFDMADIFDEMTKEEIVTWVRERWPYLRPSRADLLFIRWDIGVKKLQERSEENRRFFKAINLEGQEALAMEFNKTCQVARKYELLRKITAIDRQVKAWSKEESAIRKAELRLEKLYEAATMEREKERQA
jgi:hypothetical protein